MWEAASVYSAGRQEVSRCCTRGEPLPSMNKYTHSAIETQLRPRQMPETGVLVVL